MANFVRSIITTSRFKKIITAWDELESLFLYIRKWQQFDFSIERRVGTEFPESEVRLVWEWRLILRLRQFHYKSMMCLCNIPISWTTFKWYLIYMSLQKYDVLMQHPDFSNNIQIVFDLHVITKVRCACATSPTSRTTFNLFWSNYDTSI